MEYGFDEKPSLEDLNHYGVKGMKWGQRRTRRIQGHLDRQKRVADGTASVGDRLRVANYSGRITKRGAAKELRRGAALQKKIQDGDAKTKDILLKAQGIRVSDLNFHQN